jgi:hypothetical protein
MNIDWMNHDHIIMGKMAFIDILKSKGVSDGQLGDLIDAAQAEADAMAPAMQDLPPDIEGQHGDSEPPPLEEPPDIPDPSTSDEEMLHEEDHPMGER